MLFPDKPREIYGKKPSAGVLAIEEIAQAVRQAAKEVVLDLPAKSGQLRVRHGLGTTPGSEEMCYVIDADFFTVNKKETKDAWEILDKFNTEARLFFRWCITDKLHKALEPQPTPLIGRWKTGRKG